MAGRSLRSPELGEPRNIRAGKRKATVRSLQEYHRDIG
jgi:hypothetical protein